MSLSVRCIYCGGKKSCRTCDDRRESRLRPTPSAFSLAKFLGDSDLADVEIEVDFHAFPVQRAIFKAHRLILALQNPVFKAMFYGNFRAEDRVVITDLHPDGVLGLLRYFYSGELQLKTAQQAAYIRTAADKYLVPEIVQKCVGYVRSSMKPRDVCPFLNYVLTLDEEFDAAAKDVISAHSWEVLYSEAFKYSLVNTVSYILNHIRNVPEACVARAVHGWGKQQLLSVEDSGKHADLRSAIQPLLPQLHFLALTPAEFVVGPGSWGIFSSDEALTIISNIVKDQSVPMPSGFSNVRTREVDENQTASSSSTEEARSLINGPFVDTRNLCWNASENPIPPPRHQQEEFIQALLDYLL